MSRPAASKKPQGVQKQATNQSPASTSRSSTLADQPSVPADLSNLWRLSMGMPTYTPDDSMDLSSRKSNVGSAWTPRDRNVGSRQRTDNPATKPPMPKNKGSLSGNPATLSSEQKFARPVVPAPRPGNSDGRSSAGTPSTAITPNSGRTDSSSPRDLSSLGADSNRHTPIVKGSTADTKNPDRTVPWN